MPTDYEIKAAEMAYNAVIADALDKRGDVTQAERLEAFRAALTTVEIIRGEECDNQNMAPAK